LLRLGFKFGIFSPLGWERKSNYFRIILVEKYQKNKEKEHENGTDLLDGDLLLQ